MWLLKGLAWLIFILAVIGLFAVPGAWILMLLLGVFADLTGYQQFAIGFWPCYILVVIISLFIGGSSND